QYAEAAKGLYGDLPDAVFCELQKDPLPRPVLAELAVLGAKAPLFSFSAETDPILRERSVAIGFIDHLEGNIAAAELMLHLRYGRRMLRYSTVEDFAFARIERALTAVNSLHFSLDSSKVIESALESLPRLIPAHSWAIFINSNDGERLEM